MKSVGRLKYWAFKSDEPGFKEIRAEEILAWHCPNFTALSMSKLIKRASDVKMNICNIEIASCS